MFCIITTAQAHQLKACTAQPKYSGCYPHRCSFQSRWALYQHALFMSAWRYSTPVSLKLVTQSTPSVIPLNSWYLIGLCKAHGSFCWVEQHVSPACVRCCMESSSWHLHTALEWYSAAGTDMAQCASRWTRKVFHSVRRNTNLRIPRTLQWVFIPEWRVVSSHCTSYQTIPNMLPKNQSEYCHWGTPWTLQ